VQLPAGLKTFTMSGGAPLAGSNIIQIKVAGDNTFGASEQFKLVIDDVLAYDAQGNLIGASAIDAGLSSMTIRDDDVRVGFSVDRAHPYSIVEGDDGTHTLRFYLDTQGTRDDGGSSDLYSVDYRIDPGLGVTADDFSASQALQGTATVQRDTSPEGHGRYYVDVEVRGDTLVESTENFVLQLTGGKSITGNGVIVNGNVEIAQGNNSATGTILADDTGLQVLTLSPSQAEDKARFVFDVIRTGAIDEAMDVVWQVGNRDNPDDAGRGVEANDFINPETLAPYGSDVSQISGTVHFAAGQTSARFSLEANHDKTVEADERFVVSVSAPSAPSYHGGDTLVTTDTGYLEIVNDVGDNQPDPLPPPPLDVLHAA
jgi:hypothetical protein